MTDTDRLLDTFRALTHINSPSGAEEPLARYLLPVLEDLAFTVDQDEAGNLIAKAPGVGEPFLLCAHMDTVEPTEGIVVLETDGVFHTDGSTILGADDKAGIAVILEAIRRAERRPPLDVVFTVHEEGGLHGAKALDLKRLRARQGLVLDSGGPIGTLVTGAPSQVKVTASIHGVAAHAGGSPEKGVNAIVLAAQAIARMTLGRIDGETTANIGVIRGGQATNIVPDLVEVWGEARSHDEAKLSAQAESMKRALEETAAAGGGRAEVEITDSYHRFRIPADDLLVQTFSRVAEGAGFPPTTVRGGGGSDANIFNAKGLTCANMSMGMANSHGKDEYVRAEDMEQGTVLLTALLEHLAGPG